MGSYSSLATTGLNLLAAQQAQQQAKKDLRNKEKQQSRKIEAQLRAEERKQRDRLLKRISAERARAGAAGVATSGGSVDAILRGLETESKIASAYRQDEANRELDALRSGIESQRRRNLLQLSNQYASAGISALGANFGQKSQR